MAGGTNRRDDALLLSSTNVFAALGSLNNKKKKKKKKEKTKEKESDAEASKEAPEQLFWAPAPLNAKSWADVDDDDDDDDYYATAAPPERAWGRTHERKAEESKAEASLEESESDDGLVEVGDEGVEEIENEPEVAVDAESVTKMPIEAPHASKETERQLSKKELNKKGLEELEAVLAEFGYMNREKSSQDETQDDSRMQKSVESNGEVDKKENAPGEGKTVKKKKKDKSLKKAKEVPEELGGAEVGARMDETTKTEKFEDNSAIDMKERLKKLTSAKKKKSSEETDSAARAAAVEAAARSAKLALAKKKEKNHYNQHPAR